MDYLIEKAAEKIKKSNFCVALTGAGISVESNIPSFRGKGSLWEKFDPMKYANIDYFMKHPDEVWQIFLKEMKEIIENAEPNKAHMVLADLEKKGLLSAVITQNIDGLHQIAGNHEVIEFHGNFAFFSCMQCGYGTDYKSIDLSKIPPKCPECEGIFRPDCVFFGETIPHERIIKSRSFVSQADLMLVIGTSANVQPAASIPGMAKDNGAYIIEINLEPTPLTGYISDLSINGSAVEILSKIQMTISD